MTTPPHAATDPAAPATARYSLAVAVLVLAIGSQYFLPQTFPSLRVVYGVLLWDVLIVYGIPIAAFSFLVGAGPLRGWRRHLGRAAAGGLGWYGSMRLLALLVTIGLAAIYLAFAPNALKLLDRPNPALTAAAGDPWFFVGFSFVVGACEETIFRGWVFGFWVGRRTPWLAPALLSSALFAGVHVYYGTTYGLAAPLVFPTLFLIGFAFAATYQLSGGNLVVPAALHGANDAAAYLTLVSLTAGLALSWGLVLVGGLVGLVYYLNRSAGTRPTPS